MPQIHKMMYPTAWIYLGSSIQSCWEKKPSGACFLGAGWCFYRSGMWTSGRWLPPSSYHPLPVLPSPQLAQRQDSQTPVSSSPGPWEQSWSHSPMLWFRAKSQPEVHQPVSRGMVWSYSPARFVLQVSWNFSWKSTDKVWIASEPDPLHIPSAETPFITCRLAWSLLAHTALLPFCGLWQRQLTKLLPTPDRSMIREHQEADVLSYKHLPGTWRLFLQSDFFW